jgi:hypothetical protein
MSFHQAPEPGDPPPPNRPAGPVAAGHGMAGPGPGPGGQGPGLQGPGYGYPGPGGYSEAVATLVCGALILPSMIVTLGPAMFAMLFTRPDTGSNGKEWVANVVLYSLPALFVLLSLIFGRLALKRSVRGSSMRRIGIAGLIVAGVETVLIVLPLFIGKFDAFT